MSLPGFTTRIGSGTIPVLRILHEADPEKQVGSRWEEITSSGYPGGVQGARWQKEMRCRYGAFSGVRLFPEWETWKRGPIVAHPPDLRGWQFYGSYDHGYNNPASFHVHGVGPSGMKATLWEFYADKVPLSYIAKVIRGQRVHVPRRPDATVEPSRLDFDGCPYADRLVWKTADPSIWDKDQPMNDQPNESVNDLFRKAGVFFIQGERGGDMMVGEWLLGTFWADPEHPLYMIAPECPWLVWEIGQQRFKEQSARVGLQQNEPERLVDKHNHAFDDLKFFLKRFPPTPEDRPRRQVPATFEWWRQQAIAVKQGGVAGTYRRAMVS